MHFKAFTVLTVSESAESRLWVRSERAASMTTEVRCCAKPDLTKETHALECRQTVQTKEVRRCISFQEPECLEHVFAIDDFRAEVAPSANWSNQLDHISEAADG
mmetsp:Transcript_4957/g.7956  ORF Transcript_4957/g.7956 Transcript_4957/m.7956 type:complete len:104 (+) Transcript_4957:621-932(+)